MKSYIIEQVATALTNGTGDPRVDGYVDKVLLRIFANTSLTVYLRDVGVVNNCAEIVFNDLPLEVRDKVPDVIGRPCEIYAFNDEHGSPCVGFRFDVPAEKSDTADHDEDTKTD